MGTLNNPGTRLVKEEKYISASSEPAPFVFHGSLMLMESMRRATGAEREQYFIRITDVETGKVVSKFAYGYGLASIIVEKGELWVFASRWDNGTWNDVTLFRSTDLSSWRSRRVLTQEAGEHIFNTSVCKTDDGYAMAYETNDPAYVPFTMKFAQSDDLVRWERIPTALFGADRYAACPCLRFSNGWYYMLYLEHLSPRWWFETYMVRSRDLRLGLPRPEIQLYRRAKARKSTPLILTLSSSTVRCTCTTRSETSVPMPMSKERCLTGPWSSSFSGATLPERSGLVFRLFPR